MSPPTVFVCGATGTQGGTVTRALLPSNAPVHALVRDPSSPSAKALAALNNVAPNKNNDNNKNSTPSVTLFPGNYDDETSVRAAMRGCTAAFLNFTPDFTDPSTELRRAKTALAAAKDAGVRHVVYSSGFAVNAPERLRYWDPASFVAMVLLSKQSIEKEVREAGFESWTILRPGNFMDNFLLPKAGMYTGLLDSGTWHTALQPTTRLPMVDVPTIGAFAASAFLNPSKFHEAEIEIADELLGVDQILAKLSAANGDRRSLKAEYMIDEEVESQTKTNPIVSGQLALRDADQFLDPVALRGWGVPLSSFDAFVERQKEDVLKTYQK